MEKIKIGGKCPLLRKPCMRTECEWYTQVRGKNPQSDQEIDEYGCAIAWLPILLIENAMMQRQTGAAVESFRNEMSVPANNTIAALFHAIQSIQQAIPQNQFMINVEQARRSLCQE